MSFDQKFYVFPAKGSERIGRGVNRLLDAVVAVRKANDEQTAGLRRQGTDVNKAAASGYFVLAGVEGAQPQSQTNAAFAINTPRGGNTARVIVVPKKGAFDADTVANENRGRGLRAAGPHSTVLKLARGFSAYAASIASSASAGASFGTAIWTR